MLFNPLRQIADKFNEMQLGMIANRVLPLLIHKIKFKIQEPLKHPIFHGNIHFKDVHFSYIPDEEIKESI
jgi:ABC-type bacteriocin/lantibiotic exporter with double-glycine peptidase domain